jgi:TPR repeat protein
MSIRPVHALLAALTVLLYIAPAHAGKRYALLVGVREYDHADLRKLEFTENDIEELAKVLKRAGYAEVVVLTSTRGKKAPARKPTAANIRAQIKRLSGLVKQDDLLLVALAGHGLMWPVLDPMTKRQKDESFFCPCDARPRSKETLDELSKTMIPLGELFRSLDESGAGVRLMLVDACRNDARGAARNVDIDNLPRTKKGTAVLFSCKSGEKAFETEELGKGHGVFFYHVIQTMKGAARLTWRELAGHVIDGVTEAVPRVIGGNAKQTPHEMLNIEGRSPLVLERAVRKGVTAEQIYRAGLDAFYGLKHPINDLKAVQLFRLAEKGGHALAAARLGWMLCKGIGVQADRDEGARKIKAVLDAVRRKAKEGDPDAQTLLGGMCWTGLGVPRDDKEAVRWYRQAADRGYAPAMASLGFLYEKGRGVTKDEKAAAHWYRQAAVKGDPSAMFDLGSLYASGRGVAKDEKEAMKLYHRAAERGLAMAMTRLGLLYDRGEGVDKDAREAVEWYRRAAERGDAAAMYNLGFSYEKGEGVKKDRAEALRWYRNAAARGDEDAKKAIKSLESGK